MAHVFLSYDRRDVAQAERIASQLRAAGFDVWWDRQLAAGSEYSREIEQALRDAAAVMVLWSSNSVASPWVRDEAAKGRDRGILIPATLDGTEPPLGFGQFQTIDLSRRGPGRIAGGIKQLVAATKQKIGEPGTAVEDSGDSGAADRGSPIKPGVVIAVLALLGIAGLAVYLLYGSFDASSGREASGGKVAIAAFEPVMDNPETRRIAELATGAVERTLATNFIEAATISNTADGAVDADFNLRGTVDKAGNQVTILATLVDADSGRTLWSTEVARNANESRQLIEELAILLATVIRCSTYTQRRMPRYNSAEVLSRIFRSCEAERTGGQQYEQLPAISQALVDVAPESAQAYAYLANATAVVYPERRKQVYAAARKALELDPDNGAARWGLAIVPDPVVPLSERERLLREGLKLDPEFLWHRNHLGHLMRKVGRTEEGATWYQEFVSNYPLDYQVRTNLAYMHAQAGSMSRAREEFNRIGELHPWNRTAAIYAIRAEIMFGEPERARRWMDTMELSDNDRHCLDMVIGALRSKRTLSVQVLEQTCRGGIIHPAQAFAKFGHKEAVFALLEAEDPRALLATRGPFYVYEPQFAAVRADPRFIPWLARFGIPQYWLETDKWPDFCRDERLTYDCRRAAMAAAKKASLGGASRLAN